MPTSASVCTNSCQSSQEKSVTVTGRDMKTSMAKLNNVTSACNLTFGFINIRSMLNKFDDVIDLCRQFDVVCICESWHDSDSPILGRLRSAGYFVAEISRPRQREDVLTVNHGGIVIVSRYPLKLITLEQKLSFEMLCVRVSIDRSSVMLSVVYRPGSRPVCQQFFEQFSDLMEQLATYKIQSYIVGDFNIHLENTNDSSTQHFIQLIPVLDLV
jgi:exonuclease III